MKQHGDVYLRAGACPDSDTRGMTRCWACHIPNRILLPKQSPHRGYTSAPLGCGDLAEGDGSNRRLMALGSLQPGEESSCCSDMD